MRLQMSSRQEELRVSTAPMILSVKMWGFETVPGSYDVTSLWQSMKGVTCRRKRLACCRF